MPIRPLGTTFIAPGVFVEEVSFRSRAIEGVPMAVTGFVGPTRSGPVGGVAVALTSLAEFERLHGDGQPLVLGGQTLVQHLWHAARAYFAEGGRRLHVVRVYRRDPAPPKGSAADGIARLRQGGVTWAARHPGRAGNLRLRLTLRHGQRAADGGVLGEPWTMTRADLQVSGEDGRAIGQWTGLSVDPAAAPADGRRWLFEPAGTVPATDALPVVVQARRGLGVEPVLRALTAALGPVMDDPSRWVDGLVLDLALAGGHDGQWPAAAEIAGQVEAGTGRRHGLCALEAVEDLSLVAAPASAVPDASGRAPVDLGAVHELLLAHAGRMRHRMALLDAAPGPSLSELTVTRERLSARPQAHLGALFHPWVQVADPVSGQTLALPPSAFVAGLIGRVDEARGVWKTASGEPLLLATGLSANLGKPEQDVLNQAGVNLLRAVPQRGIQVWGARTLSTDPAHRYLPVERSLIWLQRSIERGLDWTVFEANDEPLWTRVRQAVQDFLMTAWRAGMLLGARPEEACFVRCDRTTMTQAEIDQGDVIVLIGLALLKPAEFMVVRVGARAAGSA
ncbi:phage tail sheath family protein [Leptothrix discophora]|uniref:Phage tail sheath subtilisin-like domain-containing protein n=1 Tax=Leptothrix discophora TaxID=89 RepID=A0ABT9G128_LEPDI|nr:phage tail sheath subtilisin-like domain-containing protein [Leptothrix discophora]MDP4300200.1 phage tail sheath subtilisin-like domain-containing protein [Leptothrix discophora]